MLWGSAKKCLSKRHNYYLLVVYLLVVYLLVVYLLVVTIGYNGIEYFDFGDFIVKMMALSMLINHLWGNKWTFF